MAEFEILEYPENKQAYYIRCPECVGKFNDPKDQDERLWADHWNKELEGAKKILEENDESISETNVSFEKSDSTESSVGHDDFSMSMDFSRSTNTEPEELSKQDMDEVQVVKNPLKRDYILID